MTKQRIFILGSTGSIGTQALEIIAEHPDQFSLTGLSANSSWKMLGEQINAYRPEFAVLCDKKAEQQLRDFVDHKETELFFGYEALLDLVEGSGVDTVLNSLVGYSGFKPSVRALNSGKKLALANKESLVVGGALIKDILEESGKPENLIPVDSEHSAMLQSIVGENRDSIEKIIITASGGPFRNWSWESMQHITVEEALDHPNWSMGNKITIDSATMMNKGLEIIEAHWLFGLPPEKLEAVVHPQSIIHSIVEFIDGSSKAQLGPPDMKVPIQYALSFPDRLSSGVERMDWFKNQELTFQSVDYGRFPCLRLALQALESGAFAPAILNAANEIAVERFLNNEIRYVDIAETVEKALNRVQMEPGTKVTEDSLEEADRKTRHMVKNFNYSNH